MTYSILKKNRRGLLWLMVYLFLFLGFSGCKSDEETISGKWQINKYTIQGVDSIAQIGTLHLDGTLTLAAADQEKTFFNNFLLQSFWTDTTYSFLGTWNWEEESIAFQPNGYSKSVFQRYLYNYDQFTTNQNQPYPVLFPLAGKWNIKKQGRNSLELEKDMDNGVELHLRRK